MRQLQQKRHFPNNFNLNQTNNYNPNQSNNYNHIQATSHKVNFYNNLQHYHPPCSTNQTNQQLQQQQTLQEQYQEEYFIFLINNGWWKSLICILLMNALFIVTYLKFVLDERLTYKYNQKQQSTIQTYQHSQNYTIMSYLMIVTLSLINLSYLFTQFLNPGVRNLSQIPHQQLTNAKKISYCDKCQQYKTQHFTHCSQCQICIWNYDHHCGFFSKCIGGKAQTLAFYIFLASVTIGFLTLLACMCIEMGQM